MTQKLIKKTSKYWEEVRGVEGKSIKDMTINEILRKQLELLAERSNNCLDEELLSLTTAMVQICNILLCE